jgi:lipopolysaccharide transport system permease protein
MLGGPQPLSRIAVPSPSIAAALPFLRYRALFGALHRRELANRYRSSFLGNVWMAITPLLLLAMYTFVFGVIFHSRWQGMADRGVGTYAIVLFSGLLLHTLLAETMGRAPRLMLEEPNYVTKVVFPLELLGWTTMASALTHYAVGLVLLLAVMALAMPPVPLTALWLPVIVLPYVLYLVGLGWAFSAVGVYLRDLGHFMGTLVSLLLFLSPVFYARDKAPGGMGHWLLYTPLTVPVEQTRRVLFQALPPQPYVLACYALGGVVVYLLGLLAFQKLRRGFSDVM